MIGIATKHRFASGTEASFRAWVDRVSSSMSVAGGTLAAVALRGVTQPFDEDLRRVRLNLADLNRLAVMVGAKKITWSTGAFECDEPDDLKGLAVDSIRSLTVRAEEYMLTVGVHLTWTNVRVSHLSPDKYPVGAEIVKWLRTKEVPVRYARRTPLQRAVGVMASSMFTMGFLYALGYWIFKVNFPAPIGLTVVVLELAGLTAIFRKFELPNPVIIVEPTQTVSERWLPWLALIVGLVGTVATVVFGIIAAVNI